MLHFWVIADLEGKTPEQCRQWIDEQETYCKKYCKKHYSSLDFDKHSHCIPQSTESNIRDAYHAIADILGDAINEAKPSDRFVAVLDARQDSSLKGISSLNSVQGLLILAFPDILWIPIFKGEEKDVGKAIHTALDLAAGGFNPMFDGTGVRGELVRSHPTNPAYRCKRDDVAVSIDEERHFAELTAYTAFRFGYRAYSVSTNRLAKQVMGVGSPQGLPSLAGAAVSPEASLVIFEDRDIEFPDVDQTKNEMHRFGGGREEAWPLLEKANYRVLATVAGAGETIGAAQGGGKSEEKCITAEGWFQHNTKFSHIEGGKAGSRSRFVEKSRRLLFNLFAGGMGDVWAWNLIKSLLAVGILWEILVHCPILLVPSLFLIVVALGVFRNAIVGGSLLLIGNHKRVRTFFKIRSQWRFYPKLYPGHCPRRKIQRGNVKCWCHVRKPFGGIFGLRNQCGLPNGRGFNGPLNEQMVKNIYKNALRGKAPTITGGKLESSTHAAYGMTLDLSTDLIRRARLMKERDGGIEDAIHAAVLATCAYEMLEHKTPALSIEALELRHYCEVLAECAFPGVRASLDMEDRLIDIHNSMWQICRAQDGSVREEMFANGMASICDNLSDLLRERGRYSEAAFMTRRSRYMHRLLLPSFLRSCLAYPEWVLRSPWHFAFSFSMVIAMFCAYWLVMVRPLESTEDRGVFHALTKTYEVLVCDEPDLSWPGIDEPSWVAINGPFQPEVGKGPSNIWEVCPTNMPQHVKSSRSVPTKGNATNGNTENSQTLTKDTFTVVVHTMRQIALLHLAFLGLCFWDSMQRK